jgi:[ribosomal protein S5]-alanine N-acetyltransferase
MNFQLRPWTMDDLDSLVRYANNFSISKYLRDVFPHPYNIENGKAFIEMATKKLPIHIFAIDVNGEAAGAIGIHPQNDIYRKSAELGYWIGEPFWGKGIVTEAIRQMVKFAFSNYDINRVFAISFGTNTASQRVLEKAGFQLEATLGKTIFKNGELYDELIYAIRR